jgi:hypothetical protein
MRTTDPFAGLAPPHEPPYAFLDFSGVTVLDERGEEEKTRAGLRLSKHPASALQQT